MKVSTEEFEFIKGFARDSAALVIDDDKRYFVETRLGPVAEREGFRSIGQLIVALRSSKSPPELQDKALDALTTHETLFFRDFHPFESLRLYVIPKLIQARCSLKTLRIWCAACATGQEPYSLAILLREHFPELTSWNVSILATDISAPVLERARKARYSTFEINRGLPAHLLMNYFEQEGENWTVREEIRSMVSFRVMNLACLWPALPQFDVIFMRNVLIYFAPEMRRTILEKAAKLLNPEGYLALGGAETPLLITTALEPVICDKAVFYRVPLNR